MSVWGLLWVQRGQFASVRLLYEDGLPMLFTSRRAARAGAERRYGYIKRRADLRAPPHEWRMPQPVRVSVIWRPDIAARPADE